MSNDILSGIRVGVSQPEATARGSNDVDDLSVDLSSNCDDESDFNSDSNSSDSSSTRTQKNINRLAKKVKKRREQAEGYEEAAAKIKRRVR